MARMTGMLLNVILELNEKYYRNEDHFNKRDVNPFLTMNKKSNNVWRSGITLRRKGEGFTFEWLERAKRAAEEDGYSKCTVRLNREGHLEIMFFE